MARETIMPWCVRQTEWDGIAIAFADRELVGQEVLAFHARPSVRYAVSWGCLPWTPCCLCGGSWLSPRKYVYKGDSLAEAEAAYAELEAKLIAGELSSEEADDG
jgi:hypothetical protein